MSAAYSMHGWTVRSEIVLREAVPSSDDGPPDLTFLLGAERPVPAADDAGAGRLVARMPRAGGEGPFFTVVEGEGGAYRLRVHGVCDVEIAPDLRRVTFHVDPGVDRGLASVLAGGLVISVILVLRGHLTLHASAVEHEGSAIAVTGRSGMGKSTLSTLLCRAGALLVSDDVLRIDLDAGRVSCRLGAGETRLRPAAWDLVSFADPVRTTSDGRVALALPRATTDPLSLRCVVVPIPDRGVAGITVQALSQADALLALASYPRVVGWEEPRTRGEQFMLTADLVSRVPVVVARLPWGPPFRESLGRDLLACLPT